MVTVPMAKQMARPIPVASLRLARLLRRFCAQQRGSVAIIFAIASIPLVLAVGCAVDYSLAVRAKSVLDAYADAAALSAVNRAAMQEESQTAEDNALKMFKAQASTLKQGSLGAVTANITDDGTDRTIVVSYTASVPTTFMAVAGIDSVTISGTATAQSAHPTYIDFYLLLDNTPSMGVGATTSDIDTMVNNTSD